MKSTTIQEGAGGKDSRGKAFSQVQRELTLNCPEPISVTDEDKQLINGKEDRGKAAKQETIGGLTQTTNITHKPTVLILESISYFLKSVLQGSTDHASQHEGNICLQGEFHLTGSLRNGKNLYPEIEGQW